MGKPKFSRGRARAERTNKKPTADEIKRMKDDETATVISLAKTKPWDIRSDIFKDVEVGSAIIKDRLPTFDDADAKTVITSKSFRGLNIKKKDKRKIKHALLNNKLELIKEAKRQKKEKKKREKTVITGDMLPLTQSLPSVEQYLANTQNKKPEEKNRSFAKEKTRKKQMNDDINLFRKVLDVEEFKSDPSAAIQTHLENKFQYENSMETS